MESDIDIKESQAHLSLRWEMRHLWRDVAEAIQPRRKKETLSAVALALLTEADGQDRWTSYSRSKPHYDRPRRYFQRLYAYRQVVGAMDELDNLGLVQHDRREPGARGWQSAVYPTSELLGIVRSVLDGVPPKLAPLHEPLWLRGDEKQLMDYQDNRMTNRMRHELYAQNEAISGTDLGQVLPFPGRLRRIFNNDFEHGGRFYAEGGSWQTLSKEDRIRITLDGEPVVEIDYSTFHPTLAYAQRGYSPPSDSYDLPLFPRGLVKTAFNVMLNSSGRPGARYTIAEKPEMKSLLEVTAAIGSNSAMELQEALRKADDLIDAILEKHRPIEDIFFSGAGLRLQRLDSEIAEGVMRAMRRQGVVVLPVHDSFLVAASKADLLEEAMMREARHHGAAAIKCSRSAFVPTA